MAKAISTKRVAISKSNAQMVAVLAAAAFITVFCLVAAKTIFSQNQYRGRVITAKEKARDQLKSNLSAFDQLSKQYSAFNNQSINMLGGSKDGSGDKDGSNSKLVLDALPNEYDFPALTSSLEKIFHDNGIQVGGITGTDDQLAQQSNVVSDNPAAVEMPFGFTISNGNYASSQLLISTLEHSIRPIAIDTMTISGSQSDMTVTVSAHTYYQPGKSVSITQKAIK